MDMDAWRLLFHFPFHFVDGETWKGIHIGFLMGNGIYILSMTCIRIESEHAQPVEEIRFIFNECNTPVHVRSQILQGVQESDLCEIIRRIPLSLSSAPVHIGIKEKHGRTGLLEYDVRRGAFENIPN
jgi:hypothetical protein